MVEINSVKEVIKDYIVKQLVSMGESSPAIRLLTPLAKRAIMNNIDSFDKFLKPIADKDGIYDTYGRPSHKDDKEEKILTMLMSDGYNNGEYHFDEHEAKEVVEQMYHVKDNKKYVGEKYDMNKAHEICERYKEVLPNDVEPCDVYVAINAQYHDYAKLFEEWFGGNIDNKVFESAITFWFKDVDFDGDKVWEYFHMNN